MTDPTDLVRDSGHVVSVPELMHECDPGWRPYYVAERDLLGFGPGWYLHPPDERDFPKGAVWECSCGRTWVSLGRRNGLWCNFRRERKRERRRRE